MRFVVPLLFFICVVYCHSCLLSNWWCWGITKASFLEYPKTVKLCDCFICISVMDKRPSLFRPSTSKFLSVVDQNAGRQVVSLHRKEYPPRCTASSCTYQPSWLSMYLFLLQQVMTFTIPFLRRPVTCLCFRPGAAQLTLFVGTPRCFAHHENLPSDAPLPRETPVKIEGWR